MLKTGVYSQMGKKRGIWWTLSRPFVIAWWLAGRVERRWGIIATLLGGIVLAFLGHLLMSSLIGLLLGLPLFVFGLMLILRGLV